MKKQLLIVMLVFGALSSSCFSGNKIIVPKTDIIYQSINYRSPGAPDDYTVGFVNIDGSGNRLINIGSRAIQPVYSRNTGALLFHVGDNPLEIAPELTSGEIYLQNAKGQGKHCQNYAGWFIFPINGTNNALLNDASTIAIFNFDNCETIKILAHKAYIGSSSISDSGKKVAYDARATTYGEFTGTIYITDVDTGNTEEILSKGQNPSISPDETKIAYMGEDGIYIANISGGNQKLIVPVSFSDYSYRPSLFPAPFWSPDGKLLIYHKCIKQGCRRITDFSLYKINVETGKEEKIIDNGLFPVWIK